MSTQKTLTIHDFTPWVGSTFQAQVETIKFDLELTEVIQHTSRDFDDPDIRKHPFSLIFIRRDKTQPILSTTYNLSHPELGNHPTLLEPLGADKEKVSYQACYG